MLRQPLGSAQRLPSFRAASDNFPDAIPSRPTGPISADTGVGVRSSQNTNKCYAGVRHVFLCLCTVVRCGIRGADSMSRGGPGGHD